MKALPLSIGKYRAVGSVGVKSGKGFGRKIKVAIFLLIAVMILGVLNFIAQPVWTSWNNYNTTYGFYEEPENTIETIFLGASVTANGFIPMELYENYGICAYNLGMEQQPMLASYYWLEEAYRLHSETLDTVVLDVSVLRHEQPEDAFYHKALDAMEFSPVKIRALKDYTEDFDAFLLYLFPVLSYHDRWKSLTEEDFIKKDYEPELSTRGYHYATAREIDSAGSYSSVILPSYVVNEEAEGQEMDAEGLYYLEKMIQFCSDKGIKLVLTKTPIGWSSEAHNAVQGIADENGLDFLDFNFDPLFSEIDFSYALDTTDNGHMNYYGATKLTDYYGSYLIQECGNRDVRGDENYAFLEEELADYHRSIAKVSLNEITDPSAYLSYLVEQENYVVFISVKDEASAGLTQEQKDTFASLGLEKLSALSYRASYLAVMDGKEIAEYTQENTGQQEDGTICCAGSLADGMEYEMISGGYETGNTSSILFDGTEYSADTRGLNIVVYDKESKQVIDTASFDTCAEAKRETQDYAARLQDIRESGTLLGGLTGMDRQLYLYDRACVQRKLAKETAAEAGEGGLLTYLKAFWEEEGCEIYISAKEDAAGALTEDVRNALRELGLTKLAELDSEASYLAVIQQGAVLAEESSRGSAPLEFYTDEAMLVSGGADAGNTSSILINGAEYSNKSCGLNIVIYDTEREAVVDQITYDTSTITQVVPEDFE